MQRCDVAEPDDGFGDRRYAVDDALQTVSAARAENEIDGLVRQRVYEIRQTVVVVARKTSPFLVRVRARANLITPRAQARNSPIDERWGYCS